MNTNLSTTALAAAKVNLYLHVTGKLDNGYHTLDSLITFADTGDKISVSPANEFTFEMNGRFADALKDEPPENNLVVRAAKRIAQEVDGDLHVKITLTKNLPVAAGLGGGSSDAAATIRALLQHWKKSVNDEKLQALGAELGADIPVCMKVKTARVRGFGEILTPVKLNEPLYAVLIHPGKSCSTADIFGKYGGAYSQNADIPASIKDTGALLAALAKTRNDLENTAKKVVPEIGSALQAIGVQEGCVLARMSGSGATCFGLFTSRKMAENSAFVIQINNPKWWVKAVSLG